MKAALRRSVTARSRSGGRLRVRLAEHRLFLVLLAVGSLLRVVVQVAFPPAFVVSDGPTYLRLVDALEPSPDRTVGYGVLLRALSWVSRDVSLVSWTQHVLGVLSAVLIYALLVRWKVSPRVAALGATPVLLDRMQLVLEHHVLSDVLFDLLVLLAVVVLAWRRTPGPAAAAGAGLLLGCAVLVRVVGQPTVFAAVLFCLLAAPTLRTRLTTSAAVVAAFAVPLAGYSAWYHSELGSWSLTEASGRALYMRTTTFVDCDLLELPAYQEPLCPDDPLGKRRDPTFYGWHDPDGTHGLTPPAGVTPDEAMADFARRAIAAQPGAYAWVVVRDFASAFAPIRLDYFEYETHFKWNFHYYLDYEPTAWTEPAFAAHGGELPTTRQPWAWFLSVYGFTLYVWGPLLLALLVVTIRGLVVRRPSGAETRPLIGLLGTLAVGLALVPDLTAQFTWRYQLPMVVLLPAAAALAWTRLTSPAAGPPAGPPPAQAQAGTEATPRTD